MCQGFGGWRLCPLFLMRGYAHDTGANRQYLPCTCIPIDMCWWRVGYSSRVFAICATISTCAHLTHSPTTLFAYSLCVACTRMSFFTLALPCSATTTPRGLPPASMTTSRAAVAVVPAAARAAEESRWTAVLPRIPARPSRPERPSDGAALASGACRRARMLGCGNIICVPVCGLE